MAKKSTTSNLDLREQILLAAEEIIRADGLAGLSAREIARRVGYSPGTIYNVFANLDELILHVEARLLAALDARLAGLPDTGDPHERVRQLARAYLEFTHENPRLWNLLFEHHLPATCPVPDWYGSHLDQLMGRVEAALAPVVGHGDAARLKRIARVLWAGVHGITSLSTTDKLSNVTTEQAAPLVDDLVGTYLKGLNTDAQSPPPPRKGR